MHNYNLHKFIRFEIFEEFYEIHLSLLIYYTRNSRFNLPPVRLDVGKNVTIFQSIKCFNVSVVQLCVPMSDYAFIVNYI